MIIRLIVVIMTFVTFTVAFKIAAGSLRINKLNIVSFTYYNILVFSFVGASLIYLGFKNHYLVEKIEREGVLEKTYAILAYSIIALPIFLKFFLTAFCGRHYTKKFDSVIKEETQIHSDVYAFMLAVIATVIGTLSTVYVFRNLGGLPLLSFLRNPSMSGMLRSSATKEYTGSPFVRSTIVMTFTPLISYFCWVYVKTLKDSRKQKWKALLVYNVILSIVIKTYNLEKSPVIYYFFYFYVIDLLVDKRYKKKRTKKKLYALIIVLIVVIIGMYMYSGYGGALLSLTNGPLSRVFITQPATLFLHVQSFPKYHKFLNGASLPTAVSWIVGSNQSWERSGKIVMQLYNKAGVLSGEAGVMNAFFAGEAYANWGIWGVILAPLFVALPLALSFFILLKLPKTPYAITLYIAMYIIFTVPIHGGFVDYIYSFNAIMLLFVSLIINTLINKGVIRFRFARR